MFEGSRIEKRQIAGDDEPRDVWKLRLCRHDARDRPHVDFAVDDLCKTCAQRVVNLIRAHRHERALHDRSDEPHRLSELRAAVVAQRRFVGVHAQALAAREHETINGRAHRARTLRLPPDFSTSRTLVISIACDSALHMSYTVSAATVAPVSASISTPVR